MSFHPPHEASPLASPPLAHAAAILVVDEDPAFQLGLKTFLREYVGFGKVLTARSGEEAIGLIRTEPSIEVVTLDYRMPDMNGLEVLDALRSQATQPLAVMMITGHASEELEAGFRARGTDLVLTTHFLTKPVRFEKLESVVLAAHEEVLAAQRRLREAPSAAPDFDATTESASFAELAQGIDRQAGRIAELEREVKAQRGKWRSDFWKLAFVLLLLWLAGQFGLLDRAGPWWSGTKESIREHVESWIEGLAPADPEPAAPDPQPALAPAPPEERGEPL